MEIKSEISNLASNFLNKNFNIKADFIEIQNTKKDFVGDITIVLFPYLKNIDKDKSDFGKKFGDYIKKNSSNIHDFNIAGGFLNLTISDNYYTNFINSIIDNLNFGTF